MLTDVLPLENPVTEDKEEDGSQGQGQDTGQVSGTVAALQDWYDICHGEEIQG
jgi:hypothetical protein